MLMQQYHDAEYGRIKNDDAELFEKLCLECFQAGLSWRTVLCKRDAFRQCFFGFDAGSIALMTPDDIDKLMRDSRIIRNRRKIEAIISNAKIQRSLFGEKGSFFKYIYSFNSGEALSLSLRKNGYTFVGPTICEAYLMSIGAVEGHEKTCYLYKGDQ